MIIVRVDDFPFSKSEESWKHNLENYKQFHALLSKYVDLYVLGCVPKYTTKEMLDWLAVQDKVQVALHGIEHDERFPNEFRDHETTDDIYKKLISVKQTWPWELVNGRSGIIDYIPPHNVIDRKTVDALKKSGFKRVFGGPGSDRSVLDYAKTQGIMSFYSEHPTWYGRSDELLERDHADSEILRWHEGWSYMEDKVLTFHWTWEWNIGLVHLEKFLEEICFVLR